MKYPLKGPRQGWLRPCLLGILISAGVMSAWAQGMGAADVDEWSAYRLPYSTPSRDEPFSDLSFQDMTQDGPWSRSHERRLSRSEQALLTLLQEAKWSAALTLIKEDKPDLNRRDESGITPLTLAVRAGQMELVREMLRQGANPDQAGAAGMTPLGAAAYMGHDVMLRDLLRAGADVERKSLTGQTPLHLACAAGRVSTVQMLLTNKADAQQPNKAGRYALEEAAYFGRVDVMKVLMASGVPLNETDVHGLNAVHAAALGEQKPALQWLRDQGIPVQTVLTELIIDQIDAPVRIVTP